MISKKFNVLTLTATLIVLSGFNDSKASLLQLTHDPLFLTQTVPPAIAVTFDDSGSMAWGFMGQGMGNNNATYNAYSFADPTQNRLYYNPNITYAPPIGADGAEFPNSVPTAARVDGFDASSATVDLTNNFLPIARYYYYSDGVYQLRFARIPGTPDVSTVNTSNYWSFYPNQNTRNAKGRNAFYYRQNPDNSYTRVDVTGADNLQNFANWYTYYSTRLKLGKTAMSRAFSTFGPSFKVSWQQLNNNTNLPDLEKFENDHRNDFYDWLFDVPSNGGTPLRNAFYRAGLEFMKDVSYESDDFNTMLSCQQNFHIAVSDGGWNSGLNSTYTVNRDETDYSPLPGDTGIDGGNTAQYGGYNGTGEQRIFQKTENRTTIADIAFHFWANDLKPNLKNNVKRYKSDYTNAAGDTIPLSPGDDEWANAAFVWNPKNNPAYWQHMVTYNVGMGLEARAVLDLIDAREDNTTPTCPEQDPVIADPRASVYQALRKGQCVWPDADAEARRIDDVWHSSINSRGQFLSANDPQELVESLNSVVNNILERLSRGSASTVSSGVVTDSTTAYSPGFDSSNWSGNMIARPVLSGGEFGPPIFDFSCVLTGGLCQATGEYETKQEPQDRNVFTFDTSSDTAVEFSSASRAPAMVEFAANVYASFGASVTLNEAVDYIKGDQANEVANNGNLRDRLSVLADIVHASPVVVRGPSANYLDSHWPNDTPEYAESFDSNGNPNGYLQFKIDNLNRKNIVYIGGNSGMLHAISAADNSDAGQELWSYIPSAGMKNLHRLLNPIYEHKSFVDNTPVVQDAYINGEWRTILVSGMRYGGQAYFALDVTDANATEPTVLWEFSDQDDVDMGYSYGQAQIVRVSSTKEWVALIPNGYNNSQPDLSDTTSPLNRISLTGNAVLYVVRISDGQLLAKIDTGVGTPITPNGLATPVGVDSQFEAFTGDNEANSKIDIGTDYVYAGDLYGNLWRFDLTSTNYSDWENSSSIKRVLKSDGIMDQPITIQPKVITTSTPTEEHDVVVMAATGKYIEIPDRSIILPKNQYVFGIYDGPSSTDSEDINLNNGDLVEQSFSSGGQSNVRVISNVEFDPLNQTGWKVELPAQGERVANPMALLGNDVLLVTSTITAGDDPCEAGGRSWLMALNPETGGKLDVDPDGLFEVVQLDADGNPTTTLLSGDGIEILDLIIGKPPILESLGGGNISIVVEGATTTQTIALQQFTWRRRNWTNLLTE